MNRTALSQDAPTDAEVLAGLRVDIGIEALVRRRQVRLLERIDATGSITAAAKTLGMGYAYSWNLMQTMSRAFREPLLARPAGGRGRGGGTALSPTGRRVLDLLRAMEAKARAATEAEVAELERLLAPRAAWGDACEDIAAE